MSEAILNAGRAWSVLKELEAKYKVWRNKQEQIKRKIRGHRPFKEGHFQILNLYEIDRSIVDYRIIGYTDVEDGTLKFFCRSCLIGYEKFGFDSVEDAYHHIKNTVESLLDEGGFSICIVGEDTESVFAFRSGLVGNLPWISSVFYETTDNVDQHFKEEEVEEEC